MMEPYPCRRCIDEAFVEPTAEGYIVKCRNKPWAHRIGPYKSRDKAIRLWNEEQTDRET